MHIHIPCRPQQQQLTTALPSPLALPQGAAVGRTRWLCMAAEPTEATRQPRERWVRARALAAAAQPPAAEQTRHDKFRAKRRPRRPRAAGCLVALPTVCTCVPRTCTVRCPAPAKLLPSAAGCQHTRLPLNLGRCCFATIAPRRLAPASKCPVRAPVHPQTSTQSYTHTALHACLRINTGSRPGTNPSPQSPSQQTWQLINAGRTAPFGHPHHAGSARAPSQCPRQPGLAAAPLPGPSGAPPAAGVLQLFLFL